MNADANYSSNYSWVRGTRLEDGTSLGNIVTTNRRVNVNGRFDLQRLYNHIPFLKATNDRFNRDPQRNATNRSRSSRIVGNDGNRNTQNKNARNTARRSAQDARAEAQKKQLPKNQKGFEQQITLLPDTTITVNHGKKSKRLIVSARTEDGKTYQLKYKKINPNTIRIKNKVDSALKLKITVLPKEPLENKGWYRTAQSVARLLMMVRNVSVSYRDDYAMALPGFLPTVGDAFGQTKAPSALSPGLDFAFGMVDDSYIERARANNWLLISDSIATPATSNHTQDLQLRMTLEPVRNFKIDLNASRTQTTSRSVQYMYQGNPMTQTGNFTMTTLSLRSAFEGIGDAGNGFRSKSFDDFCRSLDGFRQRVEAQYAGFVYPKGTPLAGQPFEPANGGVDRYSSDVMIPAFLSTYTSMGGHSLNIFPSLARLLPNWTIRYSGLGKLPWFRDVFKSVTLNHSYKGIFAIGSYSSYSTFQEFMNGLGFVTNATTGMPVPSSMYNVSAVSINEAFSPLLGLDVTFNNNLTTRLEYRSTRVLNLSTTSVQINEAISRDWVLGMAYKVNNLELFGGNKRRVARRTKGNGQQRQQQQNNSTSNRNSTRSNRDLNVRLDLSYRRQAAISRDIATMTSAASSGNTAFRLQFSADYTLSRLLTMTLYYDQQTNTPLLSSSSFPTTTHDFGVSIKFSLTR